MTLRTRVVVYLVVMHGLFVAIASLAIDDRRWLAAIELCLVASVLVGVRLVRALFVPGDLAATGSQLIADRDFSHTFKPVGQPEVDRLIEVYNRMITELRMERLRAEEQHLFLERIVAASPTGVLTCDLDDRVEIVNSAAAQLLQPVSEQIKGRRLGDIDSPLAAILDGLARGESRVVTLQGRRRLRCQSGEFFALGFPRRLFLVEELTQELRQSERRAYEGLIRMMSHEVNNSVGAVGSLLHSGVELAAQLPEPTRTRFRQALEAAITRSDHLRSFVSAFAEVVRLPDPELRPCQVDRLVDDVLTLMGAELASRRIRVGWVERAELEPLTMDKNQMEQVLINVIQNAAEAIGEDGSILMRLGRVGGRPFLEITDDGPGLPPEIRERVFTPFLSTKANGRGIGLTLVQEILGRHGLDFSLDGPEGGPTRFCITF